MKVAFCWATISGYMAACWRALAAMDDVELLVIGRVASGASAHVSFAGDLMSGIQCQLFDADQNPTAETVRRCLADFGPDVIVINGWHSPAYTRLVSDPSFAAVRFVMAMDTPWKGTFRQRLGGFVYRRYFGRIDRVFVTGERCYRLAHALGFAEGQIERGVYGVEADALAPLLERRRNSAEGWPRRWLSIGQYVERKGITTLLDAYGRYRTRVESPWPLTFCGKGPLGDSIRATQGVVDRGFVQPGDLPDVFAEHGALVQASLFDPWPLVIVEGCAAGLPIVCSEACGSHVELVRQFFNGRTAQTGDPESLCRAMVWMHEQYPEMPAMGARSAHLASPYSARMWARRWSTVLHELCAKSA